MFQSKFENTLKFSRSFGNHISLVIGLRGWPQIATSVIKRIAVFMVNLTKAQITNHSMKSCGSFFTIATKSNSVWKMLAISTRTPFKSADNICIRFINNCKVALCQRYFYAFLAVHQAHRFSVQPLFLRMFLQVHQFYLRVFPRRLREGSLNFYYSWNISYRFGLVKAIKL